MLFRPNFCANCGVKIERPEWYPWTSRRFCAVCEVEYKGHEMLPKVAAILLSGFALVGISGMIGRSPTEKELRAFKSELTRPTPPIGSVKAETAANNRSQLGQQVVNLQPEVPDTSSTFGRNGAPALKAKTVNEAQVSFCSAETKKGTPCSRRVKGNTRCFQHLGMPAMSVSERSEARAHR